VTGCQPIDVAWPSRGASDAESYGRAVLALNHPDRRVRGRGDRVRSGRLVRGGGGVLHCARRRYRRRRAVSTEYGLPGWPGMPRLDRPSRRPRHAPGEAAPPSTVGGLAGVRRPGTAPAERVSRSTGHGRRHDTSTCANLPGAGVAACAPGRDPRRHNPPATACGEGGRTGKAGSRGSSTRRQCQGRDPGTSMLPGRRRSHGRRERAGRRPSDGSGTRADSGSACPKAPVRWYRGASPFRPWTAPGMRR
jgi:hypothetical protein